MLGNGRDSVTLTVTARDAFDNPLPGLPPAGIALTAPPELTISPLVATDEAGSTRASLQGTTPGNYAVRAAIGGVTLAQEVLLTVLPRQVSALLSTVQPPGAAVGADGTEQAVIEVMLRDEDNQPVLGSPPTDRELQIEGTRAAGSGLRLVDPGAMTGEDGRFTLRLVATEPDTYRLRLRVAGVELAPIELRAAMVFAATIPSGRHLIGLPCRVIEASPEAVLGDPAGWRMRRYDPATDAFVSYSPDRVADPAFRFEPGRGQLVEFAAPTTFRWLGEAVTELVDVPLQAGWNAVANPFDRPLPGAWRPFASLSMARIAAP